MSILLFCSFFDFQNYFQQTFFGSKFDHVLFLWFFNDFTFNNYENLQIEYDVKKTSTNSWSQIWKRPSSKWLDFNLIFPFPRKKNTSKCAFLLFFTLRVSILEKCVKNFFVKSFVIVFYTHENPHRNFTRDRFDKSHLSVFKPSRKKQIEIC
jgi:hypothetical protein